jgi:radical SAM superfamily enzyme YgiQ (UPF0313 family)
MKTLFLHVPKFNNSYKPIGDFIWINYMPMGLMAIADYVQRHGFATEVVHVGVEWVDNPLFKIDELVVDQPEIKAIGMSLHWHYQSYDVIEAARKIKQLRPDIFIFIGGYTASFFHDQIIADYPMIDAVVRGDGEVPALELLAALKAGRDLDQVANLTWRRQDQVVVNDHSYVGDEEMISALNFSNYALLRHADTYIQYIGLPFFYAKGFSKKQNFKQFTIQSPLLPLAIGRGCPFNCTWCGGSHIPQQRHISKRVGFIYRSHESVIQTIKEGIAAGYRTMHTATDPEPATQEYFIELWKKIRAEGIETNWMFECNGLPADEFIDEFHKTFPGKDSIIAMSPECGNEALRLRHKGPGFTTEAFLAKMDKLDNMGISTEIFFTYGLPGENEEIMEDTFALRRTIMERYKHVRGLRTLSIEMEPGAPWQIDPDHYGIVTDRTTFTDFYNAHAEHGNSTYTSFGYYLPDFFKKPLDMSRPYDDFAQRLQKIKCKRLCFLHPNPKKYGKPWQGRLLCTVASNLLKLKPKNYQRPY